MGARNIYPGLDRRRRRNLAAGDFMGMTNFLEQFTSLFELIGNTLNING